jgi:hypothetical protein
MRESTASIMLSFIALKDNDCDLDVDTDDGECVEGSCTASAAASVAGGRTTERPGGGLKLLWLLAPLAIAGILLRLLRWRLQ